MDDLLHDQKGMFSSSLDDLSQQLYGLSQPDSFSFGGMHDADMTGLHSAWPDSPEYSQESLHGHGMFDDPFSATYHDSSNVFNAETHWQFDSAATPSHQVTIGNLGDVAIDGANQGHIDGHNVYNRDGHYVGHWTTDGNVYDCHDNLKGWVHPDGEVYAKGANSDLDLQYHATRGAAEGGAYILLYWCGGQTD